MLTNGAAVATGAWLLDLAQLGTPCADVSRLHQAASFDSKGFRRRAFQHMKTFNKEMDFVYLDGVQ